MKKKLSFILYISGLSWLCFKISLLIYRKKHIRVLNYHDTSFSTLNLFEKQLQFYKRYYDNVTYNEFQAFLNEGVWIKKNPGLIISFDDGLRSNYDCALPLLQKHGFTGWFSIPPGFIDCKISGQIEFAKKNRIGFKQIYPDNRIAMSWDEIRDLHHLEQVIINHTMNHYRMQENDPESELQNQLHRSNYLFQEKINIKPEIFCWVGGEEIYYTKSAFESVKSIYKFSLMTHTYPVFRNTYNFFIERTNIESSNPLYLVLFQLSGLMDLFYYKKRKAVKKKLTKS